MLQEAEKARDLFEEAVRGDKDHLLSVFGGGGLQRFHRFRNAMETITLACIGMWQGVKSGNLEKVY